MEPRVSPSGSEVAFLEGAWETLALRVVDRRGQAQTLTTTECSHSPGVGPERERGLVYRYRFQRRSCHLGDQHPRKEPRLVYQGVAEIELEDISPDGRLLLNAQDTRWEVAFLPPRKNASAAFPYWIPRSPRSRMTDGKYSSLPWRDRLSISGEPTERLPSSLVRARHWPFRRREVGACSRPREPSTLSLLPIGPEVPKTISVGGLSALEAAQWFHDGTQVVFTGAPRAQASTALCRPPRRRGTEALSDGGVVPVAFEISRDDRLVAALASNETLTLYSTKGGPPIPLPELGKDAVPVGWTAEGQLWVQLHPLREVRVASSAMTSTSGERLRSARFRWVTHRRPCPQGYAHGNRRRRARLRLSADSRVPAHHGWPVSFPRFGGLVG